MTWFTSITTSHDSNFRHKRKFHGYLFLACALLLIVVNATPVNARPKETESGDVIVPLDEALPLSAEYDDVDNIEFHQAKLVDGVLQEEHPVIMYKEDFVSEDFVPKKNNTHRLRKHRDPTHRRRRLNDQSDSEQYHPLQPEKIYFDILSSAPIVTSDESKSAPPKAHVEVISLADVDSSKLVESGDEVKRVLGKRPKKYHHRRQRREADDSIWQREHFVQKRHQNPYYRVGSVNSIYRVPVYQPIPNHYYLPSYSTVKHYPKQPVPGNFHNGPVNVPPMPKITLGSRFGGPDNTDRVIWRDYTPTRNPNQRANVTVGAPRPLFTRRTTESPNLATVPPRSNAKQPESTRQPVSGPVHNSVGTEAPTFNKAPTPPTAAPPATACVWAITSCCLPNDSTVRYRCFQQYGCNYVFWNLNPCADNIRDNVIDYLNDQFE